MSNTQPAQQPVIPSGGGLERVYALLCAAPGTADPRVPCCGTHRLPGGDVAGAGLQYSFHSAVPH